MVLDETVNLVAESAHGREGGPNELNYALIAELYRQLKKNYDDRQDFRTAGDFHYGELEMNRLYSPHWNKVLRWLHRYLGLVAWYRYASEYGENYVRPVLWFLAVVLFFSLLYPITGLHPDSGRGNQFATALACAEKLTYWCPWYAGATSIWQARGNLVGHSVVTTLYIAALQKDLIYLPSYPEGRLLALAEVLLTSTLVALFLLAVRRRFRR
jgi:hypothetical protein